MIKNKGLIALHTVALFFFLLDRLFKNSFLHRPLHLTKNYGIAYGLFSDQGFLYHDIFVIVIVMVTFVLVVMLIHFLLKAYIKKNLVHIAGLLFIITGALSNLIDRVRYGFVIDYINVSFFTVFNLSDVMISMGVGLLIGYEVLRKRKKSV